ncbi:MAG: hypothetical protein KA144_12490, partial [Xanthomonadaceae bacterium]|nr:hypothetical protein [Xanthomonadaceae bacterium]
WPYGDNVDYTMNWGDGVTTNHNGPAAPPTWQPVLASHVWTTTGSKTLLLTALRDAHGRQFGSTGRVTTRSVLVTNAAPQNIAPQALAVASSTYCSGIGTVHCYSPSRANDGSNSTALGGFTSWSNNGGTMPQWLELQWGQLVSISRIDMYTTAGYELRDYDIEYWNGTSWVKAALIRSNTAAARSTTIAPVQTFRLRILTLYGSTVQPGYARINEIEVY